MLGKGCIAHSVTPKEAGGMHAFGQLAFGALHCTVRTLVTLVGSKLRMSCNQVLPPTPEPPTSYFRTAHAPLRLSTFLGVRLPALTLLPPGDGCDLHGRGGRQPPAGCLAGGGGRGGARQLRPIHRCVGVCVGAY